jgi:GlpG protein
MRLIGHLESEGLAERISRVLLAQGIHHLVEPDEGPRWALWVHAEEDLDRARQLFTAFRANPDDPAYRIGLRSASSAAPKAPRRPADPAKTETRRAVVFDEGQRGLPALTLFLLVGCGAIAFITGLSSTHPVVRDFQISEVPYQLGRSWELFLPEVRRGEVWRLFTPALLHFGWPHLLFNLWILWDLGVLIEQRRGPRLLLTLVLVLGVLSNLGQYMVSGPRFGGFSGIIYGLLGYVWMMGRYHPAAGMGLHPQTVVMMLVWFVICLTGALGVPVANTAHGVGLVAGVVWGRLAALKAAR